MIQVDNAAALSFQKATKANTKLTGVYNLQDRWVQELRDGSKISTKTVDTAVNISDVLAGCLPSVTRDTLFMQVARITSGLRSSHVRNLGRALITGAQTAGDKKYHAALAVGGFNQRPSMVPAGHPPAHHAKLGLVARPSFSKREEHPGPARMKV